MLLLLPTSSKSRGIPCTTHFFGVVGLIVFDDSKQKQTLQTALYRNRASVCMRIGKMGQILTCANEKQKRVDWFMPMNKKTTTETNNQLWLRKNCVIFGVPTVYIIETENAKVTDAAISIIIACDFYQWYCCCCCCHSLVFELLLPLIPDTSSNTRAYMHAQIKSNALFSAVY